jgi:hypothetical protein
VHELDHVLGIASRWFAQLSGQTFVGPTAKSVYGGPVPVDPLLVHWDHGTTVDGQPVALDPLITVGTRVGESALDFAGLRDLGWSVSGVSFYGSFTPIPCGDPVLDVIPTGANRGTAPAVVLTGERDGSAQVFGLDRQGLLVPAGAAFYPFPGFAGVIRPAVADFNGDGIADLAFATGSGTAATVRIVDGATGDDLVGPTIVLGGFTGGAFLAAGDVDRDGKAELVVSADVGGGPRVSLFRVTRGRLVGLADFLVFGNPDFRGGVRVEMADLNGDGSADLIVGAGVGGGPRVLVIRGAVLTANPGTAATRLTPMADFFALDAQSRDGVRVATIGVDIGGRAELVVGSGNRSVATVRVIPPAQMAIPQTQVQHPFADPLTVDGVYVG